MSPGPSLRPGNSQLALDPVLDPVGIPPLDRIDGTPAHEHREMQVVAGGEGQVLLLEHPPVFTAGKRTEPHERPFDGTPVVDVDRGGKITFHGPGQLVGYPVVRLPQHVYVVDYVRRLEEALIAVCQVVTRWEKWSMMSPSG